MIDPRCCRPSNCQAKGLGACRSCAARTQQRQNAQSPKVRKKIAATLRAKLGTPEARAAQSAKAGAFLRDLARTPERRAQQSAQMKKTQASAINQARMGWLTDSEKAVVDKALERGNLTYQEIADEIGVSRSTIYNRACETGRQRGQGKPGRPD